LVLKLDTVQRSALPALIKHKGKGSGRVKGGMMDDDPVYSSDFTAMGGGFGVGDHGF
jgi:hypothetical protein